MTTSEMHAAEGPEPAACSGRRAHDTLSGSVGRNERAARKQIARPAAARSGGANPHSGIVPGPAASPSPAAEGSEPTAGGGLHVVNRFSIGPLAPEGNAARTNPLAGEGTSAAGLVDGSSLNCAGQVSQPARRLSRFEFVHIATQMLEAGATWRDVSEACGLSWKAAKRRGEEYGLRSPRGPGRPAGSVNSPETMARIAETLRRRWWEGRR